MRADRSNRPAAPPRPVEMEKQAGDAVRSADEEQARGFAALHERIERLEASIRTLQSQSTYRA